MTQTNKQKTLTERIAEKSVFEGGLDFMTTGMALYGTFRLVYGFKHNDVAEIQQGAGRIGAAMLYYTGKYFGYNSAKEK